MIKKFFLVFIAIVAMIASSGSASAAPSTVTDGSSSSFHDVVIAAKLKGSVKKPYYDKEKNKIRSSGKLTEGKLPKGWSLCIRILQTHPFAPPGEVGVKCVKKKKVSISVRNWCAPYAALLTVSKKGEKAKLWVRSETVVICK
ncbi:hypothetical protein H3146_17100 [Streptomyces sp. OF3]|uniref:Subtilisin inhibitor domain-containing protein n=1 Tax=Streptomyces alkaliterrae TaxID=2213162 RepID=A0A7W3WMG5_9ACTN|nr:hypothetical protein [Streptomyces alkaliterrae]MBB1255053.1 hypothetical protein [Streptomyces alkaliterrae]